jgi:hypothetical protein
MSNSNQSTSSAVRCVAYYAQPVCSDINPDSRIVGDTHATSSTAVLPMPEEGNGDNHHSLSQAIKESLHISSAKPTTSSSAQKIVTVAGNVLEW